MSLGKGVFMFALNSLKHSFSFHAIQKCNTCNPIHVGYILKSNSKGSVLSTNFGWMI